MTGVADEEGQVVAKAARRIIPFLAVLYFISFLDRVNVGYAALTMSPDIGLSATAYGFGAGVFFLGYCLFEVPSNLILTKVGARRWIARIMISWGLASAGMSLVWDPASFWVMRFLLGVAEAGFFPGIVLYLSTWFPRAVRGRILGSFLIAVPVSNVLGAPLSAWLLQTSFFGLAGLLPCRMRAATARCWIFLTKPLAHKTVAPSFTVTWQCEAALSARASATWLPTRSMSVTWPARRCTAVACPLDHLMSCLAVLARQAAQTLCHRSALAAWAVALGPWWYSFSLTCESVTINSSCE